MADAPAIGDQVHVPGVGTGTLRERRGTTMVVEIKGIPVMVPPALVRPADPPKRGRKPVPPAPDTAAAAEPPEPPIHLDLHGLSVADALEALDAFLDAAMRHGRETVLVVHGRSGGRIRAAVHERLRELPSIRGFRLDPRNPGQTIVTL